MNKSYNESVHFYGRTGGVMPSVDEVAAEIVKIHENINKEA